MTASSTSQHRDKDNATEDTPLVVGAAIQNEESAENTGDMAVAHRRVWDELDRPWPSTFGRSISILSSPLVKREQADLCTISPKPGSSPMALTIRRTLERGFHTPDSTPLRAQRSGSFGESGIVGGGFLRPERVHSLDLNGGQFYDQIRKVQADNTRKAEKAKEYRSKFLQKKQDGGGLLATGQSSGQQEQRLNSQLGGGGSTFLQCMFNLANILMGVGLLGLPFVFRSAGWYGGTFSLLSFGLVAWRTSILIGRELNGDPRPASHFVDSPYKSPLMPGSAPEARMLPPITSFPDIARVAFGQVGCIILSATLYFELFSCICVAFVTIGDHLHQLFPNLSTAYHMVTVAAVSLIPTAFLRTPTLLSYLSMVGTCATVAVVMSVIASAIVEGDIAEEVAAEGDAIVAGPYHIEWKSSGLGVAFGIVAYCFSGHAIVPSIYSSMERPQDFEKMVTVTFVTVVSCCLAVAISGYYMFGSTVQDQITLSLEESSSAKSAMTALIWLMILTAFSKITLTMFPLAMGMEEMIAPYLTGQGMVDATSSLIKFVLTALTLVVAIFVPSFSFLCALVGMICTMSVSVIFPAWAHLAMFGERLTTSDKLLDWLFVISGVIVAVVGTIATLNQGA